MSSGQPTRSHHHGDKKPPTAAKQHHVSSRALVDSSRHQITIGHATVIHPKAVIVARDGPIEIGDYCIVEEYCEIRNELADSSTSSQKSSSSSAAPAMVIGHQNHFCVRSEVRSGRIGSQNRFLPGSSLGIASAVGDHCIVEPYCRISHDVSLPSETVVFGGLSSLWAKREHFSAQEEKEEMICLSRALRSTMKE